MWEDFHPFFLVNLVFKLVNLVKQHFKACYVTLNQSCEVTLNQIKKQRAGCLGRSFGKWLSVRGVFGVLFSFGRLCQARMFYPTGLKYHQQGTKSHDWRYAPLPAVQEVFFKAIFFKVINVLKSERAFQAKRIKNA